ncbi:MAG: hypothetical protein NTY93_00545 [Candidatus Kaiserbacteria bacterium]|nr:hypothetical protein [Candidatus Kaiserbacteria bacterium]
MNISTSNSFLKHFRYNEHLNPVRDWLLLLVFSAIVLAGIIVWNVWAFDTIANGGVIGTATTDASPVFNQSSLDTINTIFANRAEEKAKYETGAYRFANPSQ